VATLLSGPFAHSEYRLYRLKITNTTTQASRTVTTTLDNVQYRTYHQVHPTESVTIDAHWWCWDRPAEKYPRDYCPQPSGPTPKFTATHYQP